jgi:hypothetical protein
MVVALCQVVLGRSADWILAYPSRPKLMTLQEAAIRAKAKATIKFRVIERSLELARYA